MDLGAKILTTRWAVRLPIPMFKTGFGFVFLGRLLMLEHRGRVSGERRYVVIEAAEHESHDRIVVASGFGRSAQWYRNLEAEPRCGVSVGWRRRVPARAELLDADESRALLERYAARYPKAWAALHRSIVDATGETDPEIPMVRLHLESARPPR
ncbi:nitroreductase family deazaflavin-dependent oxidoreductase [Agromyces endophyticus]|uniref:nitroreductase family deazaflavin-dependent oxidoreductase n=1 Tax=Agromyces sp. H17E-10 TaxID=2932244 RepID=UPI001FD2638F|nr:nitroreductase family deazaflavin-dependent oxidoreductase [Agromyces sp. H17E-10]UOQ88603.1 nitroreductase family deazaflavin-dependent oxidoreductase [Agromyces sp. H17E-10]